jgi:AcrR family transcriptional regulator
LIVPKTRPGIDRDEKVEEIVAAAERMLRAGGYEALSVVGIARELDLAQNAIYWYFPSKNHLFVAALQRLLEDIAERKAAEDMSLDERILWFTDELAALFDLRAAISEQARRAEVVAGFSEQLDAVVARMLTNALRGRVPRKDLAAATQAFRATIVGTYAEGLDPAARRELLKFTLRRLTR